MYYEGFLIAHDFQTNLKPQTKLELQILPSDRMTLRGGRELITHRQSQSENESESGI